MTDKIIITGGPGTGKSSLIKALEANNFKCFNEISREITLKYRKKGIEQLFLSDPILFSEELLKGRIEQYNSSSVFDNKHVFFDRAIPDIVAYLNFKKANISDNFIKAINQYRYDIVFLLEPWKNIYSSDIVRYESFDQVISIDSYIKNTYNDYGYKIVIVPKDTIDNRVDFIINKLKQYQNE